MPENLLRKNVIINIYTQILTIDKKSFMNTEITAHSKYKLISKFNLKLHTLS